jgi:hypothetical protein
MNTAVHFSILKGVVTMSVKHNSANTLPDYVLNEVLDPRAPGDLDGLSIKNQRLARIQEYEEEAISRENPFEAVIGMGNASLQRVFEQYGQALIDAFEGRDPTLEEMRQYSSDIRLLLKVRKSIETDIALQTAHADQSASAFRGGPNRARHNPRAPKNGDLRSRR